MPAGRPKKRIDLEALKAMAAKQWSTVEMAAAFQVHRSTLERKYSAVIEEGRQRGRAKIRDLQWKRAMEGSDRLLLHISKHYLGQHDQIQLDNVQSKVPLGSEKDLAAAYQELQAMIKERECNSIQKPPPSLESPQASPPPRSTTELCERKLDELSSTSNSSEKINQSSEKNS